MTSMPRTVTVPPFAPDPLLLKYVQVADHIAARIEAGDLPGGQRLPAERDLAAEYGVSYVTVRKSTKLLRARGLIITMHGHGTRVVLEDRRPQHQASGGTVPPAAGTTARAVPPRGRNSGQ